MTDAWNSQLERVTMKDRLQRMSYEVEIRPGEKLTLPQAPVDGVGAGRWVITVSTSDQADVAPRDSSVRSHDAFLKGYSQEDEGLYDDLHVKLQF